jgi:hypothetical protein
MSLMLYTLFSRAKPHDITLGAIQPRAFSAYAFMNGCAFGGEEEEFTNGALV